MIAMDGRKMEAAQILLSDRGTFMMGWNRKNGWAVVNEGCPSLDKAALREKGLEGLPEIVLPGDKELCRGYQEKITGRLEAAAQNLAEFQRVSVDLRLRSADGEWIFYTVETCIGRDVPERMLVMIREMSAEEIYRAKLARNITNDKNPEYFSEEAEALMQKFPEKQFALIQFDVERFKVINEQYGEETGDAMLSFFIEKLRLVCSDKQLYVRLSADVFMLITAYEQDLEIIELIERINRGLLGYRDIPYRLVFGVCKITDPAEKLRHYGDGAAFARQSVKGNALQYIGYYRSDMREKANSRKFVEDNMEKALREGQFVMYLQPKYSISGNHIVGAEALARWNHPERGLISPACFIPAFEENGFVVKLDQYIWEQACKAIRNWIDQGIPPLPVSVNVSRRHLKDGTFVDVLDALVDKYQIPKGYLEIEITETIDENQSAEYIQRLGEHGYRLLMDDFGSGYSSLNMLKDTPFDVIKIDREFLQDFMGSGRGQEIVRYTIQMTHAIGLDLVAEGVETKDQAEFLSDCGCDIAQGFYYAKPMPLEDFNKKMEMARKP